MASNTRRQSVPALDRALARVRVTSDGCWVFQGATTSGYGTVGVGGRGGGNVLVHRLVYSALIGVVSAGLDLDHLCRNRACCNPGHLEPVTRAENAARGDKPGPKPGSKWTPAQRAGRAKVDMKDVLRRAWETRRGRMG